MIKKLSNRIFFLIMISLETIIIGIIVLFAFSNYRNTINTAGLMMDIFVNRDMDKNIYEKSSSQALKDEKENFKILENDILENQGDVLNTDIEGVYHFKIRNSEVIQSTDASKDENIEKYAIEVSNNHEESGIVGKYIYKTIRGRDGDIIDVTLIENENVILQVRKIMIISVVAVIVSIVIVYIVAKKVSESIVKPVEETFEKQKQFISDASHELKTPLAVIEANADVLENEVGNNKWLGYIQNEIESMDRLINELLLLSKIENIDNIKEYKQIDVSKEAEIIIAMFESMAYEKNVKISSNIQKDISITGNKQDIEHILSTLIDNAISHAKETKDVIVELSKEKNEIIIEVKNTGEPIPKDEREKIFERFYRIDKSRNRSQKRYGLGLAIAKSVVEKYNGKIEVFYKNGFTIFRVSIPI